MLPYLTESFGKSVSGSSLCVPVPGNSGKNRHTRLLNRIAFKPRCFQPDILAGFYCTVVTGKEWLSMFFAFYNIIKNPKWSTNDIIPKLDKKRLLYVLVFTLYTHVTSYGFPRDQAKGTTEYSHSCCNRHVQYSSLVRVEKLNIRLVRVIRVEEVSVILFMEMT